jgi:hypothetical protein
MVENFLVVFDFWLIGAAAMGCREFCGGVSVGQEGE